MNDHPDSRDAAPRRSTIDRRTFVTVGGGVGAALLAGCTSGDETADGGGGSSDPEDPGGARFRLLVSDAPADIDDFDRLDVSFDSARVFERGADSDDSEDGAEGGEAGEEPTEDHQQTDDGADGGNATNETPGTHDGDENGDDSEDEGGDGDEAGDEEEGEGAGDDEGTEEQEGEDGGEDDEERGFYVLELDGATVDLTEVVGDRAKPVFDGELAPGSYEKLELHVADVDGVVDGETAEVKVPSGKLQLTKPFEVEADGAVDFVFDINVVKRGQEASYNLKPVVSESGVAGEDVDVEEVDDEGEGGAAEERSGQGEGEAHEGEDGNGGEEPGDDQADSDESDGDADTTPGDESGE